MIWDGGIKQEGGNDLGGRGHSRRSYRETRSLVRVITRQLRVRINWNRASVLIPFLWTPFMLYLHFALFFVLYTDSTDLQMVVFRCAGWCVV